MKKVLITGATSGIGRELAIQFASKNYIVGLLGRRTDRLEELAKEIGEQAFYRTLDVTDFESASVIYPSIVKEMGGMDIIVLNAGVGRSSTLPDWEFDKKTIDVNVAGFVHGMHFAFGFFKEQGYGQIVGMSSVASHLASGNAAVYTASKHFISNFMTGFRQKANKLALDITVTDIRPGFVWSEMTEKNKNMFWVANTKSAVEQMISAIEKRKKRVYITKRWQLIALIAELTPQFVWDRLKL